MFLGFGPFLYFNLYFIFFRGGWIAAVFYSLFWTVIKSLPLCIVTWISFVSCNPYFGFYWFLWSSLGLKKQKQNCTSNLVCRHFASHPKGIISSEVPRGKPTYLTNVRMRRPRAHPFTIVPVRFLGFHSFS